MRWSFRRKAGRHQLGAAVTAIPSAPPVAAVPTPPSVTPPVTPAPVIPALPDLTAPEASPEPVTPQPPRIELGFRDGTTAALAPGSAQARALSEIASVLTQRD